MRALVIPPTKDLIATIADHLQPQGNDFSACRVVFPGKRPQHFLLKELGQRVGKAFLPPQVHAIDGFAEFIARKHVTSDVREVSQLDAVRLLFDIHRSMPERLGGDHFLAPERFLPLGLRLFSELEELALAMASPRLVREKTSIITSGELHLLADVAERFAATLTERRFTTRARLYVSAAESFTEADVNADRQLIFAGFYGLTPAERQLMMKVGSLEKCLTLWTEGPGLGRRLQELGVEPEFETTERVEREPEIDLVESPDTHGEVFAVAVDLRDLLASGRPMDERTVIVAPRPDTLFPLLHFALNQLPAEDYNVSLGFPLERTPLAGLFHALHELAATSRNGRFTLSAYLGVVLHPYVKNVRFGQRTDVSRILIHTVEEHLAGRSGYGTVSLEEVEHNTEIFTTASFRLPDDGAISAEDLQAHLRNIHDRYVRSWMRPSNVGAFAVSCINLVQDVHERTTAPQHPNFRQFADAFIETLQELERSMLADLTFPTDDIYFDLLRRVLTGGTVPFPGSPLHGVQVLGVLETRSLRFDTVTILDANDDVLPGRSGPEALLPQKVRQELHMDTNHDREEIVEYYMTTLLRGAQRARIMYVGGGGKERSRIVERLVWDRQRKERSLIAGNRKTAIRYDVSLSQRTPDDVPKTEAIVGALRRRAFSATALDAYLRCPLQFYYSQVLGLRERDDVSDDIDMRDVGQFVHDVLQEYLRPYVGRVLEARALSRSDMERQAGGAFDRRFGLADVASRVLMRERVIARLGEFVDSYQVPAAEKSQIEIVSLESKEEATIGETRFSVRFDRVERRTDPDGNSTIHILDYKTGGKAANSRIRFDKLDPDVRETWPEAIGSLQLALYAIVYAASHQVAPESIQAAYVFLGRHGVSPKIETGLFDKSSLDPAEGLAMVRKVVDSLIRELFDLNVPFRPTDDLDGECPRCPFSDICGTTSKRERDW